MRKLEEETWKLQKIVVDLTLERLRNQINSMFHPTIGSLRYLIWRDGFWIEKEVWQKTYHNVIYLQATHLKKLQVGFVLRMG